MPFYKTVEKNKVAASRISEICKQYEINKPLIGFWKKEELKLIFI